MINLDVLMLSGVLLQLLAKLSLVSDTASLEISMTGEMHRAEMHGAGSGPGRPNT